MERRGYGVSVEDLRRESEPLWIQQPVGMSQASGTTQIHIEEILYRFDLVHRVATLEEDMREIKKMLQQLLVSEYPSEDIIELRDVSYDQAMKEIAQYFHDNDGMEIGYEKLVEELKIDPKLVVRACNELVKEGKIG